MGRIPLRTTLSQIPLKSFGFPGAESARKRFFLRGAKPPAPKKSAPGATNRNLRFRLVGREAACLPFGQATFPPRRSPASIGSREGSHPLELSRGCSDGDFGFRRSRLFFCGRCFRRRERGALRSPTPPRVTGCERGATLSRSPGTVLVGIFVSDDAGCSPDGFCFRRRGRGALCSPTSPRGTGGERGATLSRSPGAVLVEIFVSDGAGCSLDGFVSDDAGVGCSAPLHPLG